MDSNRTERVDTFGNYDSSVNNNNENKKKADFNSKRKRSSFSSHNSNNSGSCYESNFETYKNQIINDNFNSNTYEVLKYVDNNNLATNQTNKKIQSQLTQIIIKIIKEDMTMKVIYLRLIIQIKINKPDLYGFILYQL